MNCSICKRRTVKLKSSDSGHFHGVAVCDSCYLEFTTMMELMNKNSSSRATRYPDNWGTNTARGWIKEAEAMQKKVEYFGGLAAAFTDESYSDIQIKPGSGPSIPAHKVLLATRSEVFKNMLSSDVCKSATINDSVCLPEFSHEELETFLELLYCGNLPREKFEMHYYCLAIAANKYAIPHLEKFCEEHILKLLDSSNALKVLELSEICSNETLRAAAMESILCPEAEIIDSPRLEEFATENPHLMVHMLRHSCKKRKT